MYRNKPYLPNETKEYAISRSKIELYMQCPRCFWLDCRLKIKRPSGPPFSLNKAVDELLKKEFDGYRKARKPHPIMIANDIVAIPFAHPDLDIWRENFKGIRYKHDQTGLVVYGAIDDVWISENEEILVVDYKATAKTSEVSLDAQWQISYKRQVEVYQWLLRKLDFKVSNKAIFIYTNGKLELDEFNDKLEFTTKLIEYDADCSWVDEVLFKIKDTLDGDMPEVGVAAMGGICDFCDYARKRTDLTLNVLRNRAKKK